MTEPVSPTTSVVPAAEATDPVACPEPIFSPSEWPTSRELESGIMAVDVVDVPSLTANVAESAGEAQQPLKRDTVPAPPPTPEDVASVDVP